MTATSVTRISLLHTAAVTEILHHYDWPWKMNDLNPLQTALHLMSVDQNQIPPGTNTQDLYRWWFCGKENYLHNWREIISPTLSLPSLSFIFLCSCLLLQLSKALTLLSSSSCSINLSLPTWQMQGLNTTWFLCQDKSTPTSRHLTATCWKVTVTHMQSLIEGLQQVPGLRTFTDKSGP